jgi:menaquinol-cytochrome c reductase iron-sulfur subunit
MKDINVNKEMTRRSFLDYSIRAVGAFITAIVAVPVIGYVVSPAFTKKKAGWVQLGKVSEFRVQEPKLVEFTLFRKDGWVEVADKKSVWVVRRNGEDFTVYNSRCTHLGCAYNWQVSGPHKGHFVCPCHNGIFSIDGKVLGGPPPRPLDRLQHKVEGGKLQCIYEDFRLGVPEKIPI